METEKLIREIVPERRGPAANTRAPWPPRDAQKCTALVSWVAPNIIKLTKINLSITTLIYLL